MNNAVTRSYMAKKEEVRPEWFVVDASSQIVGRLATKLATILMGKHKPGYTPHVDCGDYVIVVNAEQIQFSGQPVANPRHPAFTTKWAEKTYERYSGYPGGRKIMTAEQVWERHPERIIEEAVRRMLPKSKLGRQMLRKLKVYKGSQHPHQAQQPRELPEHLRPR